MDIQGNDVESQILQLDGKTRARLAVTLIRSLDSDESLTRKQVEELWLKESEERLQRMESGEDPGVEASAAILDARNNLHS